MTVTVSRCNLPCRLPTHIPTSDPLRHSHRLPHIRPGDRANLHPSYICRHADNQKSGQAAFEGAEGKGKTFPLEMQLYDLMRGATRACAVCERCSELKALEAAGVELFPPWFLNSRVRHAGLPRKAAVPPLGPVWPMPPIAGSELSLFLRLCSL